MEEQLSFPWFNYLRFIEKEISLDIDRIKAMLGSADRIKELLARREAIEDEQTKLAAECAEIDVELSELTGQQATPANGSTRAPQRCSICQEIGHTKRTCTKGAS